MPEPALLVVLALAVSLAAFINGTIGFGFALLAVNALAVVLGAKSGVVVMSLLAPVVSGLQLLHHRGFMPPWRRLAWLLAGAILGSLVGTQLLVALPGPLISISLGVFTIGYVALTLLGERRPWPTTPSVDLRRWQASWAGSRTVRSARRGLSSAPT